MFTLIMLYISYRYITGTGITGYCFNIVCLVMHVKQTISGYTCIIEVISYN